MKVKINDKWYNVNNLEEINTLVPPEEIIKLVFEYCSIRELPIDIFKYNTNLQVLRLGYNMLTYLPEDIFKYNTNLQKIYLTENKLTNLPENIFQYNTNLLILSLYCNKLTNLQKNIFKYNTNLRELYLSNNELLELPENIFKNNTNLQVLYLNDNNLKELPENIFKYNTNLQDLNLAVNILTELPENIFKYNTNLQKLHLGYYKLTSLYNLSISNNKLTNLPENIFKYNTNLQNLNLSYNKLTNLPENIFKYNTNLHYLFLDNNQLRRIPSSILNCNRLEFITYDNNEINYIPPNIQRFLNRLKNKSNELQIFNDRQNVHNHEIQECVKNSINNILSIPKTIDRDKIMTLILESKLSETSKRLILEYCNDTTVHTVLNVTFEETLHHIFQYIVDHLPDKLDNITEILDTEMQDSECKCFTGRISRLINCLGGISDLVEVKIPENMERSNIVLMLRNKYSGQELIDNIVKEFTERGYQEHIEEYIDAL